MDPANSFIPKALEILSLFHYDDHATAKAVIAEYSTEELRDLLSIMTVLALAFFRVSYDMTELTDAEWMPHFNTGLTRMVLEDD